MPFPAQPSPRTWSKNDIITVPRLRADVSNLAWLLTMRPALAAQSANGYSVAQNTVTPLDLDTEFLDNWNGHTVPSAGYECKLPGWYLCDGNLAFTTATAGGIWGAGIETVQNSVTSDLFGQVLLFNGTNPAGPGASDLVQLDVATRDSVSMFAYQSSTATATTSGSSYFKAEWAGLPTTAFADAVTGTVVASPVPAALWPPGAGTQITNAGGIAAGAVSMTVASNTGIVTGGTLGLDFYEGQAIAPAAETVSVTSVAGTTIGISATTYPHGGTATPGYVAVPVSAAFMNQQVRDTVNFLAYPPMARIIKSTQTIAAQVFPASTTITFTSATVDNFSGWNGSTTYTFPVAGLYYVYGCVPFPGTASNNYHLGISINGGTVQWGDSVRNQSAAQPCSATFRRHVRATAGQTLTLQVCVSTTGVTVPSVANTYAILIVVWRGF